MNGKAPIRAPLTLADMFGGFPLAYKVFAIAAIIFCLFNFGSAVVSTQPVYAGWLDFSQPFTDAAARFVPAVDSATTFLETHHGSYMIPAVRNALSIDFALLIFFPSCFAAALCIDLFRDSGRALSNIDAVSKRLKAPINEVILRCAIFLLLFFLPIYFGYGANPFVIGFAVTMIYYVIVLGGNGLCLFITTYLIISVIALKLGLHTEHQGGAAPD